MASASGAAPTMSGASTFGAFTSRQPGEKGRQTAWQKVGKDMVAPLLGIHGRSELIACWTR